jgi:hypothetical protein
MTIELTLINLSFWIIFEKNLQASYFKTWLGFNKLYSCKKW